MTTALRSKHVFIPLLCLLVQGISLNISDLQANTKQDNGNIVVQEMRYGL
jgi:hypothetical protein